MDRRRTCQSVTDRLSDAWIIDIAMCIGNARFVEPVWTLRSRARTRECLLDTRTVSNSVEFSLLQPSQPRIGRVRVVQRQCRTRQPSRNSGVCAPKQELHAYPFILENPCRSEVPGNTLHIPHQTSVQRTTAYLRLSRVPSCIYVYALVTYFPRFDPFRSY